MSSRISILDFLNSHQFQTMAASEAVVRTYKQIRQLPQNAPSPRSMLGKYEDFVSNNASSVSQIESALRSLTYIIPGLYRHEVVPNSTEPLLGRFRESEIASETRPSLAIRP